MKNCSFCNDSDDVNEKICSNEKLFILQRYNEKLFILQRQRQRQELIYFVLLHSKTLRIKMAENKGKNRKSTPESLNESKRKSTYAEMTKKTNQGSFSEEDRTKLTLIYENVASLREEMKELREELEECKLEIKQLKTENNQLKQALNLNTFETDNLQQYSRRENIRIHASPNRQAKRMMVNLPFSSSPKF